MENGILEALRMQLRIDMYSRVFEGAKVIGSIPKTQHGTDKRPKADFCYTGYISLVKACRGFASEQRRCLSSSVKQSSLGGVK